MEQANYKLIGTRVREKRLQKHYSQEQLSWETNISTTHISHIETAKKKPSLDALICIANALDITMDELLTGNLINNLNEYQSDIKILLEDCSSEEKRYIYELLSSSKKILRNNGWTIK